MSIHRITTKGGLTRYRFSIDVGRDAGGRRQQDRYTFDTYEEAVIARHRIQAQVADGTYVRRAPKRIPQRHYKVTVAALILTGRCSGQCLTAIGAACDCCCGGKYHGAVVDTEVTLRGPQA